MKYLRMLPVFIWLCLALVWKRCGRVIPGSAMMHVGKVNSAEKKSHEEGKVCL